MNQTQLDHPRPERGVHRFLTAHGFYAVAVSTAFCAVLLTGRYVVSGTRQYGFLVWNLVLAWLPYAFAVWAVSTRRTDPRARKAGILPAFFRICGVVLAEGATRSVFHAITGAWPIHSPPLSLTPFPSRMSA